MKKNANLTASTLGHASDLAHALFQGETDPGDGDWCYKWTFATNNSVVSVIREAPEKVSSMKHVIEDLYVQTEANKCVLNVGVRWTSGVSQIMCFGLSNVSSANDSLMINPL